jgi:hypothetical protein
MKWNLFLSASLRLRNIGFLIGWFILINLVDFLIAQISGSMLIGFAVYCGLIVQSFFSKEFINEFLKKEKIKKLKRIDSRCTGIINQIRRYIVPGDYKKLTNIICDKNELIRLYSSKVEDTPINEDLLEKSMNLIYAYIKLMRIFYIRIREMRNINITDISNRINDKKRKISFLKDEETIYNLTKSVENDEKILEQYKNEQKEINRIRSKMEYMESTINMLKHQVVASIDNEEFFDRIDESVNEAEAIGSALEIHKKSKIKLK